MAKQKMIAIGPDGQRLRGMHLRGVGGTTEDEDLVTIGGAQVTTGATVGVTITVIPEGTSARQQTRRQKCWARIGCLQIQVPRMS